jgi:hypothetical protein
VATLTTPAAAALDLTGATVYFSVRTSDSGDAETQIDACDAITGWTDASGGDVAISLDNSDYQEGTGSVLLTIADGAGVENLVTKTITSVSMAATSSIHLWVKSSVNTDAGDFQFLLDDTAACASPVKTLDFPALTANTWTRCVLFFDTTYHISGTTGMTAIISMGIKQAVDKGACTLRIDDICRDTYLIEKLTGSIGADPTLGIATFNVLASHTEKMTAGTWEYDVTCYWAGTGVYYSPIISTFEALDHAFSKD